MDDQAGAAGGLEKLVARLVAHLAPDMIVLFGSYARGRATPRSDIDLLVIGPFLGGSRAHLRRARRLVSDHMPAVDVALACPAELEQSPFLRSVMESGIVLWRRGPDAPSSEICSSSSSCPL